MISSGPTTKDVEEKTEVIYGAQNIIESTLNLCSVARSTLDNCVDSNCPSMHVIPDHPITKANYDMKERGVKIRFITEITKENIHHCRELMNFAEVRHLDEIKGNFGVLDGRYYRAGAKSTTSSAPPLLISSTIRAFVEQQQYFFDMLWRKAIPAKQRMKEIEEGLKRAFIETIQDSDETFSLVSKVLSFANEEILIIFSNINTISQFEKHGIIDLLKSKAKHEIKVRVLIDTDHPEAKEFFKGYQHIELRYLLTSIQAKLTTIVTDRELSLVIEEREDEDTVGLTTYSNSGPTVLSYASRFETLWFQSRNGAVPF